MRLKHFLSVFLTLLTLSVGQMWGTDQVVATFSSSTVVTSTSYTVYQNTDWYLSKGGNTNSCGFNSGNKTEIGDAHGTDATATHHGYYIESKSDLANVYKVTFTFTGKSSNGDGKLYLAYSTDNGTTWDAVSLKSGTGLSAQGVTANTANTTYTFEFNAIASARYALIHSANKTLTTKSHLFRYDYVTATFYAAGCTSITPSLSYASVGGTTLTIGSSSSGSPTITGNTGNGTVTYSVTSASPAGCATVNETSGVVSAVAAGTATITASIGAKGDYCAGSATADFTITQPAYTVSFNTGTGNPLQANISETSGGAGITLPAGPEPACSGDGWVFMGWKETSAQASSTTAPDMLAAGMTYKPTSNCTLYAVYYKPADTNPNNYTKVTSNSNNLTSGQYVIYANSEALNNVITSSKIAGKSVSEASTGVITTTDADIIWTLYKNGTNYQLYNAGVSKYLEVTGQNSLSLPTSSKGFTLQAFNTSTGQVSLKSVNQTSYQFQYYNGNFSSYGSQSTAIFFYKRGGTYNSNPSCCTSLGSINGSFF